MPPGTLQGGEARALAGKSLGGPSFTGGFAPETLTGR